MSSSPSFRSGCGSLPFPFLSQVTHTLLVKRKRRHEHAGRTICGPCAGEKLRIRVPGPHDGIATGGDRSWRSRTHELPGPLFLHRLCCRYVLCHHGIRLRRKRAQVLPERHIGALLCTATAVRRHDVHPCMDGGVRRHLHFLASLGQLQGVR